MPVSLTRHEPGGLATHGGEPRPVVELRGKRLGAFCGIGNPEAFRRTLGDLGAEVVDFRTYPDHHGYTRQDVEALMRWADGLPDGAEVATTQKDLVKIRLADLAGRPLAAVRIGLTFLEGRAEFDRVVTAVVET